MHFVTFLFLGRFLDLYVFRLVIDVVDCERHINAVVIIRAWRECLHELVFTLPVASDVERFRRLRDTIGVCLHVLDNIAFSIDDVVIP